MIKKLLLLPSNIPAALVGGGLFLLTLLVLQLSLLLAIGISLAGYLIGGLLIFPAKPAIERERDELLDQVLKDGHRKLARLNTLSKEIKKASIRQQTRALCEVAENIFDTVQTKPEHVRSAQQFSDYYLDTTLKIVRRYLELAEHKVHSNDVQHTVAKAETMLNNLHSAFEKQLSSLLHDDVVDLDTELAVLEETLKLDDL